MSDNNIDIYTDGSCQLKVGAWAAIVFIGNEKIVMKDTMPDTTHNRMELLAVIKAVCYAKNLGISYEQINVFSDSQYVVNLIDRRDKLQKNLFFTKKGSPIPNVDLVKQLLNLLTENKINFIKVAAHQRATGMDNYNRDVDKIVRKVLREAVDIQKQAHPEN